MRPWLCWSLQALRGSSGSQKRTEAGSARTKGSPGSALSPCTSPRRLLKRREWSRFQRLPRGPSWPRSCLPAVTHHSLRIPRPCLSCAPRRHGCQAPRGERCGRRHCRHPTAIPWGCASAPGCCGCCRSAPTSCCAAGASGSCWTRARDPRAPDFLWLRDGSALPCPALPAADGPPAPGAGPARGPLTTQTPINLSSV